MGVEDVLTRSEAVQRYHLMASRIGDLVVLGDRETVFGELDTEQEALPPEYRSHGSLDEMDVPLVIHNAEMKLQAAEFRLTGTWRSGYMGAVAIAACESADLATADSLATPYSFLRNAAEPPTRNEARFTLVFD